MKSNSTTQQYMPSEDQTYQPPEKVLKRFRGGLLGISTACVCLSAVAVILWIAVVAATGAGFELTGIWVGAFLICTSAIGLAGTWQAHRGLLVAYLSMSILASVFTVLAFSSSTIWSVVAANPLFGFAAFLFFIQFILSIVASGLLCGNSVCCKGCCCCCEPVELSSPVLMQLQSDGGDTDSTVALAV